MKIKVYNHNTGKYVDIDIDNLAMPEAEPLKFAEFQDANRHTTEQGMLHSSRDGILETTGLATCVALAVTNLKNGKHILAHIDAVAYHSHLTELLRQQLGVIDDDLRVYLFRYTPPTGDVEDYQYVRASTVVAVSLAELGLLERARVIHNITPYDRVIVTANKARVELDDEYIHIYSWLNRRERNDPLLQNDLADPDAGNIYAYCDRPNNDSFAGLVDTHDTKANTYE